MELDVFSENLNVRWGDELRPSIPDFRRPDRGQAEQEGEGEGGVLHKQE